jgi:hypothetical protein
MNLGKMILEDKLIRRLKIGNLLYFYTEKERA